jgi:UrcA family protein
MDSNTAALASRAGSGPENPISLCVALVAAATSSVAPAHGECHAPPFQLLTDIAWLAGHYCPPCDAAGVAPNRKVQQMKNTTRGRQRARAIQLVTAITVGAAAMATVPAHARVDESAPRSITVNVQDLDLSSPRGQDVLRRRIRWAADIVCGSPDTRDLRMVGEYRSCVNDAANEALAQLEFPRG